mgnify:CR=1 FL=1
MSLVIDNSMALAWTLIDEHSDASDTVLNSVMQDGGHVPFIFRAEYANGLTMAVRRKRLDDNGRSEALAFLESLDLTYDFEGNSRIGAVIGLADRYSLTVYDALYLELAQRLACPLGTFDKKLARAARDASVALVVPGA